MGNFKTFVVTETTDVMPRRTQGYKFIGKEVDVDNHVVVAEYKDGSISHYHYLCDVKPLNIIMMENKYIYRNGMKARILCNDAENSSEYPVISIKEDGQILRHTEEGKIYKFRHTEDGKVYKYGNVKSEFDLIEVNENKLVWINIHRIYNTKEEADKNKPFGCIGQVQIEVPK